MRLYLLEYKYRYSCQGSAEVGTDIALVYVPDYGSSEEASFNHARSILINTRYDKYDHDIIVESVTDKTIY